MDRFPDDEDGRVLNDLAEAGVDLTLPRLIEFTVEAESKAQGRELLNVLEGTEYAGRIEYTEADEDGEKPVWMVYAGVEMVPDYHELIRHQKVVSEVAEKFGLMCDGWVTEEEVVEP